jgi:hypothetical protein
MDARSAARGGCGAAFRRGYVAPLEGKEALLFEKEAKLLRGCRRLIRDSPAKVSWFFFSRKNCFLKPP